MDFLEALIKVLRSPRGSDEEVEAGKVVASGISKKIPENISGQNLVRAYDRKTKILDQIDASGR